MDIRPTRNELKDVALLGLAYSMLNYSNNATDILVNDDVFNDIRNEEIELRALELLSSFLDKYFS